MLENQADASSAREETTEAAAQRCGDCRTALTPRFGGSAAQAPTQQAGDFYCPDCAKDLPVAWTCEACGSAICPSCGTPVELADELGIG